MNVMVVAVVGVALLFVARRRGRRVRAPRTPGRRKAFLIVATILGLQLVVFAPSALGRVEAAPFGVVETSFRKSSFFMAGCGMERVSLG